MSVYRLGDILVDTGGTRVTEALLDELAIDPPKRIVLTHQHEDHSGNVAAIVARFGEMSVHAPRALVAFLTTFERVPPYRAYFWGDPLPLPAHLLVPYDAGDAFEAAGHRMVARHTPGHTPPHHAFVLQDGQAVYVLSGDLYSSRPLEAFLESSMEDTVRTYRDVASFGDALRMLPTHGWVRPNAAQVLSDAADWIETEAAAIEALATELGTRDPIAVAERRYGPDKTRKMSSGEMGTSIFVRAVLDPVKTLPATPLV